MTLNGDIHDNLTIADANGAVIAVVADESICYNGVRLFLDAEYTMIDGMMYVASGEEIN